MGVWDWNAVTNEVFFSDRWAEILGYNRDELTNQLSEWENRVHPDDLGAAKAALQQHFRGEIPFYQNEHRMLDKYGRYRWILDRGRMVSWTADSNPLRMVGTHTDITVRKTIELENQHLLQALRESLERVNTLSGLLPICASCKKIRDAAGQWHPLEDYISAHSDTAFSHGLCGECEQKLYPFADPLGAS